MKEADRETVDQGEEADRETADSGEEADRETADQGDGRLARVQRRAGGPGRSGRSMVGAIKINFYFGE